mmetsp:Transcript_103656/g.323083  ORF Transcript_103656/g.323083 Transcript_103656/m.323083 type:complete len:1159 (+) Transcript_103656:83-3559(+)
MSRDYDISFSGADVSGVSMEIAACLESKGFCVIQPGLPAADFEKALKEVDEADATGKLVRPSDMIVEGLLGAEGSARIMDLDVPDDTPSDDLTGLKKLDQALTETSRVIDQYLEAALGFSCPVRTPGLVHETGMATDEPPELGLEEGSVWMTTFMRHKLMVIFCLGPIAGTLELRPFDEDAEVFEVPTQPGSLIILRADAMTHRHFAHSKALLLSTYLMEYKPLTKHSIAVQENAMVPVAQELQNWTVEKMKEIKEREYEYNEIADIPQAWSTAMNSLFHCVQRVAIRGMAGRYASTYHQPTWFRTQTSGVDYCIEIPLARWSVHEYYDPDPECWRWNKCYLKHGSFMDGADLFDNRFFGLSISEAAGMDVHQREVLEVGYDACWGAGYKKGKMMNVLGGVYLGSSMTIFGQVSQVSGATGGAASINSNRFSFCLGMKGPSMTVDTEGSSGLASIYLASEATLDKGRGTVNAYSIAGGVSLQLGTIWWPQLQSAGLLSRQGRCLTFDQAAEGYCMADGCLMSCLKRLTENVGGEQVYIEGEPLIGTLAGASMNSNGLNAKMNAPNGPAEQELIAEAVRTATIAPVNVDAVECHGQGAYMADAVEIDSVSRVLRGVGVDEPIAVTSTKSIQGHANEASGTVAFMKALMANAWGTVCPNLHLKQINPHVEPESKIAFSTEVYEYPLHASYTAAVSHGFGGTNVCAIVLGECEPCRQSKIPEEFDRNYITFWPGGGGELPSELEPRRAYYISGSWSGWMPESMQNEGDGSFGFTVTLGENRWEDFQILLDADRTKCLHPEMPMAHKGAAVCGPDHRVRSLCWRITGTAGYMAPAPASNALANGGEAAGPADLKVVSVGAADQGQVGDQYRVHLQIAGKYCAVSWEKTGSVDPATVPAAEYYVASSWGGWTLEKMTKEGSKWSVEALLLRDGGEFQIVRNEDWGQVFGPEVGSASAGSCTGPQDVAAARGQVWRLDGDAGDVFRITFERSGEEKKVSWERLRSETLTKEQQRTAKQPVIGVVGSWSGYLLQRHLTFEGHTMAGRMPWAGGSGASSLSFFVEVGPDGEESFQLLQDGDWDKIVHPFKPVEGADSAECAILVSPNTGEAAGLVWTIGTADNANPGQVFKVSVMAAGNRVGRITWAPATDKELGDAVSAGLVLKA